MFDWALESMSEFVDAGWAFTFVTREDESVQRFVRSRARALGIEVDALVPVRETTRGQAESALHGSMASSGPDSIPLVIFNVDTFVEPTVINPSEVQRSDGWIPCFPGDGSSWSFVSINESGYAVDVAEKRRISKWASVGLYGFRSRALFVDTYWHHVSGCEGNEELFVAPLYKVLLAGFRRVRVPKLDQKHVVALGTPSDVKRFDSSFSPPGVTHFS